MKKTYLSPRTRYVDLFGESTVCITSIPVPGGEGENPPPTVDDPGEVLTRRGMWDAWTEDK